MLSAKKQILGEKVQRVSEQRAEKLFLVFLHFAHNAKSKIKSVKLSARNFPKFVVDG